MRSVRLGGRGRRGRGGLIALLFVQFVGGVAEGREDEDCVCVRDGEREGGRKERRTGKPGNSQRRPPRQHPPQPLDLTLAIAVQRDRNLIIQLLDGAIQLLLLHAHRHLAIVQQPAQIVL